MTDKLTLPESPTIKWYISGAYVSERAYKELRSIAAAAIAEVERLTRERDEAITALMAHGEHSHDCPIWEFLHDPRHFNRIKDPKCNCGLQTAIDAAAIAEVERLTREQDTWIAAQDALPKEGQMIVAFYKPHGTVWAGRFRARSNALSHWIPLPELPAIDAAWKEGK